MIPVNVADLTWSARDELDCPRSMLPAQGLKPIVDPSEPRDVMVAESLSWNHANALLDQVPGLFPINPKIQCSSAPRAFIPGVR